MSEFISFILLCLLAIAGVCFFFFVMPYIALDILKREEENEAQLKTKL